ncbi:unnamed protein product, partial [marine sediment metagenome]
WCFEDGSGVTYDSSIPGWYLNSDLSIYAADVNLQATLLSGYPNTYLTLENDGSMKIFWTVQFESDYLAEGTYNELLYIKDLAGIEDEIDDVGLRVMDGSFDFWDLGDFTFESNNIGLGKRVEGQLFDLLHRLKLFGESGNLHFLFLLVFLLFLFLLILSELIYEEDEELFFLI